jgi:hypothetical protein
MIKDREVAMVNAASMALEYRAKHPRAWDDDAVAHVVKNLRASKEIQIYAIAAANEIIKMRKLDRDSTDKQLLQEFINNVFAFIARIEG